MKHTSQILKMIEELLQLFCPFASRALLLKLFAQGPFLITVTTFFTLKWYDKVCYCESEFLMVSAL